jgi:AcrR family transcriptional regulator
MTIQKAERRPAPTASTSPSVAGAKMPTAHTPQPRRRSSGRPRGADSVSRREEILATAATLFSAEGFRGLSMSTIARTCGISPTGLAHYFPTKELLLQAVMERRDELDEARISKPGQARARGWAYLESMVDLVRHNQNQPGIVSLFTTVTRTPSQYGRTHQACPGRGRRRRNAVPRRPHTIHSP